MRSILKARGFSRQEFEDGKIILMSLYSCCHCQFTWEAETGSLGGKLAGGFCGKCVGYICKKPECLECIPYEQRLENIEAGKLILTPRRVMVPVPDLHLIFKK